MKRTYRKAGRRFLAAALSLSLLPGILPGLPARVWAADRTELDAYTAVKDDSYQPSVQGWYGFFPALCCVDGTTRQEEIPALVKDGHAYLDAADVCDRLGMEVTEGASFCVKAGEREVYFPEDSAEVYIRMGPARIAYTMPVATVRQDGALWVPAEWFFRITGATFFPTPNGYVALGAPERTALDVVLETYENPETFSYASAFSVPGEALQEADDKYKLFDTYDGIFSAEGEKWTAAFAGFYRSHSAWGVPQGESGLELYDLVTDAQYAEEYMKLILETAPYEVGALADDSKENAKEVAIEQFTEYVADFCKRAGEEAKTISENFGTLSSEGSAEEQLAYLDGSLRTSGRWHEYAAKKAQDAAGYAGYSKAAKGVSAAAKPLQKILFMVLDYEQEKSSYQNRDMTALEGANRVLEDARLRKESGDEILPSLWCREMEDLTADYGSSEGDFAFSRWLDENAADYVTDIVTSLAGAALKGVFSGFANVSTAYTILSALNPGYGTARDVSEAFEYSMIGLTYQNAAAQSFTDAGNALFGSAAVASSGSVTETVLSRLGGKTAAKGGAFGFCEGKLDAAVQQAYQLIKARSVTRGLALTVLEESAEAEKTREIREAAEPSLKLKEAGHFSEKTRDDILEEAEERWEQEHESFQNSEEYQNESRLQTEDAERLKLLAEYCKDDLPLPGRWVSMESEHGDSYLAAVITPAYVHVTGTFVDAQTGEPVKGVSVQLTDSSENLLSEFQAKDDGSFDLYVPLPWRKRSDSAENMLASAEGSLAEQMAGRAEAAGESSESGTADGSAEDEDDGNFVPWEEKYWKYYAYPSMSDYAPVTLTAAHEDYPEWRQAYSGFEWEKPTSGSPVRELCLNLDRIELGDPYYPYIRDNELPVRGYVSQETTHETLTYDNVWMGEHPRWSWDDRRGLLGADIADLDGDGVQDMLLYYFDIPNWPEWNNGFLKDPSALYVDLYTLTEEGEVRLVDHEHLLVSSSVNFALLRGGLMEKDGRTYLYVEDAANAYFADGGGVMYSWYGYDKEQDRLRLYWQNGKTGGGSSDMEYSFLDYTAGGSPGIRYTSEGNYYDTDDDGDAYEKEVLYANGMELQDYMEEHGGAKPPADDFGEALDLGFSRLGLPDPQHVTLTDFDYTLYKDRRGLAPTYWDTETLKPSFSYLCSGSGDYRERYMTVSVQDFTELKEHIDAITVP